MNQGKHKDFYLSNGNSQPITSEDQSKLLVFALLMVPALLYFGVGLIPIIFLSFGITMMKRNQDFSSIEVAVKNFKRYTTLTMVVGLIFSIASFIFYKSNEGSYSAEGYIDGIWGGLIIITISFLYHIAVIYLFYRPLKSHSDWVVINGIFGSKAKAQSQNLDDPQLNIIKGEKFKQYSVADELIKWAKLKEDGHISEEEFNEARAKLLNKN